MTYEVSSGTLNLCSLTHFRNTRTFIHSLLHTSTDLTLLYFHADLHFTVHILFVTVVFCQLSIKIYLHICLSSMILHRMPVMHEMQPIATDVRDVCSSVCMVVTVGVSCVVASMGLEYRGGGGCR